MNSIMLQSVIEQREEVHANTERDITNTIAEAMQKYGYVEVVPDGGMYLELNTGQLVIIQVTVDDLM